MLNTTHIYLKAIALCYNYYIEKGGDRGVVVKANRSFRHVVSWPARHKKLTIGIAGVLLFALVAWFAYRSLQPAKVVVDNPVANQYREKLPELKKTAESNKSDVSAQREYAVALYATGDTKAASTYYEKAVKLNDGDATLHNNLGNTYRDLGQVGKAIAEYRKAISLNKKLINPHVNLANVQLYSQNKPDDAITTYNDALKAIPDNDQLRLLLGLAYEKKGDTANAKKTYQSIVANDPDNAGAKANLDRLNKQ